MLVQNKTILLTGASTGIGRELALLLAKNGNRLIVLARRKKLLDELVKMLPDHPQGHISIRCDVSKPSEIKKACTAIAKKEIDIDILILNAGIGGTFSVKNMHVENDRYLFEVNFFSHLYFLKLLLPRMLQRKTGTIVAVGSLAGYRGMPKSASYSASKAAVARLIESLRIDLWNTGIKCVLVSPGFVKTPMTDKNRFRMPFMITAEKAARTIVKGLAKQKTEIHFPYRLSWLAKCSLIIPDNIYAKIMQGKK
jgi:short-subunit dehydrogenase